jgi:hypothetical protein
LLAGTCRTSHQAGRPPWLMAGTQRPLDGETYLIDGWYIPAIGQGDLPDCWLVLPAIGWGDLPDQWLEHTGHWAGRPPSSLASMCHRAGRSPCNMALWAGYQSGRSLTAISMRYWSKMGQITMNVLNRTV